MPPEYVRIVDAIERAIAAGELAPGARLPSIRELCAQYGVGATTVKTALGILEDRGRVVTRQGAGTYVAERPDTTTGGATGE